MKKIRYWLILLLTLLAVAAGAFLPELLLTDRQVRQGSLDALQVNVNSRTSSDFPWRMERIAEQYFGEPMLMNYISDATAEDSEIKQQFFGALERMIALGVAPPILMELLDEQAECRISYFYLFDSQTVSGFRIAEFTAAPRNGSWQIFMCMDVESGKVARLSYSGSRIIPEKLAVPATNWYDVLLGYGEYLGLGTASVPVAEKDSDRRPETDASSYYDDCTAERCTARITEDSSDYLELRVLREKYQLTVAVYDRGK